MKPTWANLEERFFLMYHLRMSNETISLLTHEEVKWLIENFCKRRLAGG